MLPLSVVGRYVAGFVRTGGLGIERNRVWYHSLLAGYLVTIRFSRLYEDLVLSSQGNRYSVTVTCSWVCCYFL